MTVALPFWDKAAQKFIPKQILCTFPMPNRQKIV